MLISGAQDTPRIVIGVIWVFIAAVYFLRAFFGLGGVILGQPLTDYIAVLLSVFLWRKIRKNLENNT